MIGTAAAQDPPPEEPAPGSVEPKKEPVLKTADEVAAFVARTRDEANKTAIAQARKELQQELQVQRATDTAAAKASLPQLAALRGGTLGLPADPLAEGLHASVDTQLLGNETNANAFAKLGGLSLADSFRVDFLAETFEDGMPRIVLDGRPASPRMYVADIAAGGFRVRYSTKPILRVSELQTSACLQAWQTLHPNDQRFLIATRASADAIKLLEDRGKADAVAAIKKECKLDEISGRSNWTLSGGLRILRRGSPEEDGKASIGIAGEAAVQYEQDFSGGLGLGVFASPSAMHLNDTNDKAGTSTAVFPAYDQFRLSVGLELRGNAFVDEHNVLPRFGVYGTAAWGLWENDFNFGTTDANVRSLQAEAGIFASGRFVGGFQGLVSFAVLKPFGNSDETQFIISIMPSVGPSAEKTPQPVAASDEESVL